MKSKTIYASIRIDFEHDGRFDENEVGAIVTDQVINDALSHIHTIESGVSIVNIENCGENE